MPLAIEEALFDVDVLDWGVVICVIERVFVLNRIPVFCAIESLVDNSWFVMKKLATEVFVIDSVDVVIEALVVDIVSKDFSVASTKF